MAIKLGASYRWQSDFYLGKMTLENCIAHLHSVGGTGFELIPGQMLPDDNFVRLSDRFIGQWFERMDKYKMTPPALTTSTITIFIITAYSPSRSRST